MINHLTKRALCSDLKNHQKKLMMKALPNKKRIPNVKKVLAIGSAKGGVGKSAISVQVAQSLINKRFKVGILDGDLHGPSLHRMLAIEKQPNPDGFISPFMRKDGLYCVSMGMFANKGPIAWRGPMLISALNTLLFKVKWPCLDWLVIDLPPGTGDIHLSLLQTTFIDAMLGVSIPQMIAIDDLERCFELFRLFKVPIRDDVYFF